ncbi:class I SAM-dependent methyltransferase [Cellulomonas sp. P5_E12]
MRDQDERREIVTRLGRLREGRGLEIGPLNRPLALKSHCDVRYVDVFSGDIMRERFRADPHVIVDDIPDIDFPLHDAGGKLHALRDAAGRDAPYRWVLASHVIEHVPDLIGWLSDIAEVLEDGGALVLVVPDRRYSFDVRRPHTTVGQMLEAHENRDVRPTIRAVYDHFSSVVSMHSIALWAGHVATDDDISNTPDQVACLIERMRGGEYIDSHVWIFTPSTFAAQIAELARLGVIDFYAAEISATEPGELEFFARLVRLPRDASAEQRAVLSERAVHEVTDVVVEVPEGIEVVEEEPLVEEVQPDGIPTYVSTKELQLIRAKRRLFETVQRLRRR